MIRQSGKLNESGLHHILLDGFVMFIHLSLHTELKQTIPVKTQVSVLNILYLLKNNNRGDDQYDGNGKLCHYQPFSDPRSTAAFHFNTL